MEVEGLELPWAGCSVFWGVEGVGNRPLLPPPTTQFEMSVEIVERIRKGEYEGVYVLLRQWGEPAFKSFPLVWASVKPLSTKAREETVKAFVYMAPAMFPNSLNLLFLAAVEEGMVDVMDELVDRLDPDIPRMCKGAGRGHAKVKTWYEKRDREREVLLWEERLLWAITTRQPYDAPSGPTEYSAFPRMWNKVQSMSHEHQDRLIRIFRVIRERLPKDGTDPTIDKMLLMAAASVAVRSHTTSLLPSLLQSIPPSCLSK